MLLFFVYIFNMRDSHRTREYSYLLLDLSISLSSSMGEDAFLYLLFTFIGKS